MSVVIDRETLERVREYTKVVASFDGTGMRSAAHKDLAALDAALAAPEPFERLEDGALLVGQSYDGVVINPTFWVRHIVVSKRGEFMGKIGIDRQSQARAVALALLTLTEEGP